MEGRDYKKNTWAAKNSPILVPGSLDDTRAGSLHTFKPNLVARDRTLMQRGIAANFSLQ